MDIELGQLNANMLEEREVENLEEQIDDDASSRESKCTPNLNGDFLFYSTSLLGRQD